MTPQRITLVTLGVADIARSRAFYEALGWRPTAVYPGMTAYFLAAQGLGLGLYGRDDLAADQGRAGTALGTGAIALAQNMENADAVDTAFAAAIEAGATVLKRPQTAEWGGHSGYYADPDGHVWEVAWNPAWPLDEAGRVIIPEADA